MTTENQNNVINTWGELASAIGVTDRSLRDWRKLKGAPKGYDVAAWKKFNSDRGLGNRSKAARDPILEELKDQKMRAQTEVIKLQTERIEIRNALARGEAIPIDQAREQFQMCWKPMIQHLRGTKHRLGQAVVGLPSSGAAKIIAKDLQETADMFCVPEHLKRDPFWREMDKQIQKIKKQSGKI